LRPTLESTALKLMEEAGELGAAIGKVRGLSGERVDATEDEAIRQVALELLDVAQTAVTMMFVLERSHGINLDELLGEHIAKLVGKGYLVNDLT
jgi:NTP pyrophosphatase (non-canonical NTP hydrolase)